MLLDVETVTAEEVEVSVEAAAAEYVEEEVDKVEEDTAKKVMKKGSAHIKTELTYHMSPVTLNIQSGLHSKMIQGRGSLRTWCAQIS